MLLNKLFCYQQIEYNDQIKSCKSQIINQLQSQNLEFLQYNKTIQINQTESIKFKLALRDCYSEETLLLSKINNLNITDIQLLNVSQTQDILVLQEINELYIDNLDLNSYIFNDKSILQINQVKNVKINQFKSNGTLIDKINSKNLQIGNLNINFSTIRNITVINQVTINNLQSIESHYNIISDQINITSFNSQQSKFIIQGIKNIFIDVCQNQCNLALYFSQLIHINKLYLSDNFVLKDRTSSSSIVINNLIIEKENFDLQNFDGIYFTLQQFKKVVIYYSEIKSDNINIQFQDIKTLELNNINLYSGNEYGDKINYIIEDCRQVKIKNFHFINPFKIIDQPTFIINRCSQATISQFNIESVVFDFEFMSITDIKSLIIEDFELKSIGVKDMNVFFNIVNCQDILFNKMKIQLHNGTIQDDKYTLKKKEALFDYENNLSPSFIKISSIKNINPYFKQNITFNQINSDFSGKNLRFLSFYNKFQFTEININVINCNFRNMNSNLIGGCLSIIDKGDIQNKLKILKTKFYNCSSYAYGGAIFTNGLITLENVVIEQCKSMFGAAIVIFKSNYLKKSKNLILRKNKSTHYNDIFIFWQFFIDKVIDISEKDQNGNVLKKIQETNVDYKNDETPTFNLFPGITYIFQFSMISILSNVFPIQEENVISGNTLDEPIFQNLYPQIDSDSYLYPYLQYYDQGVQETNAYLILKFNYLQWFQKEMFNEDFVFFSSIKFFYQIQNCTIGQQKIKSQQGNFTCEYCPSMFASHKEDSEICYPCNLLHFSYCYSNVSFLNQGFYRDSLIVNVSYIHECKYNKQSCLGGKGFGNDLCSEGHIGNECKICDKYGQHWNQTYGSSRYYQCVKCNQLNNNMTKIIMIFLIFVIITLWIINNTTKNIKLQILQTYIIKMNKMNFRSRFKKLSLISVYAKVLTFNASIIYYIQQQINLRFQTILLDFTIQFQNPLMDSFYSVDCFLLDTFTIQNNYGFTKFLVITLFPILSIGIIFIIQSILIPILKLKKQLFLQQLLFSILYLTFIVFYYQVLSIVLDYLFCIPFGSGDKYSLLDLSVSCDKMQINKILLYSVLIGYCFGIPLFIILVLFRNRLKLQKINIMFKYGFLYKEYNQKYFYWEIIRFFIRVCQLIISKTLLFNFVFMNVISLVIFLIYLILLILCMPFKTSKINKLELISIFIIIINIFSLITYQTQVKESTSDEQTTAEEYMLIICLKISIIYIIVLLAIIFYSFFEMIFEKLQGFQMFQNCYICRRKKRKEQKIMQSINSFKKVVKKIIQTNRTKNLELQIINCSFEENNQSQISQQQEEGSFNSITQIKNQNITLQYKESSNQIQKETNNGEQFQNLSEFHQSCEQYNKYDSNYDLDQQFNNNNSNKQ